MTAAARPTVPMTDAELDALDYRLSITHKECEPPSCAFASARAAIAALRAERDALREALRKFCIKRTSAVIDPPHGLVLCLLCKTISRELDPRRELGHERDEQHAPGCLAAPPKEPSNG